MERELQTIVLYYIQILWYNVKLNIMWVPSTSCVVS